MEVAGVSRRGWLLKLVVNGGHWGWSLVEFVRDGCRKFYRSMLPVMVVSRRWLLEGNCSQWQHGGSEIED